MADPSQPRLVFQPIVDLARGAVVGYEALARFAGPPSASPDRWFAAAAEIGQAATLEARVIGRALGLLDALPPNSFLTVNVSPDLLRSDEVSRAFATGQRLDRLMVELTEHAEVSDVGELVRRLDLLRERGARIVIDDAGTGYSGLSRLLEIRPAMVKLDRALICDIDRDPARRALVEMIGPFAGRLDAWILAEGVERLGELEELVRLGVPLAQGFLLGRPDARWTIGLPPALRTALKRLIDVAEMADSLAPLMECVPALPESRLDDAPLMFLDDPGLETLVLVDVHERPVALHGRHGERPNRRLLLVRPGDPLADTAQRAMTRDRGERYDPLVCCDERGRYLGLVGVDRLLLAAVRQP